ncbi:sal-like protein 1 isoform X2 [Saccoglossus kowalevskii]|uniref:Spalt-like transcription factor isoform X1 n=2 Tax=Saccoglossus kowalevskii TaxID=10224 RepID=A0ABM0GW05_SACKO|nr:PREDICTED: spalt-like transcription factor isoform X1 [Saccoglossus kowalevskii]
MTILPFGESKGAMSRRKQAKPQHLGSDQDTSTILENGSRNEQHEDTLHSDEVEEDMGGDVHVCGKCRREFVILPDFIQHKKTCTKKRVVLLFEDDEHASDDGEDSSKYNGHVKRLKTDDDAEKINFDERSINSSEISKSDKSELEIPVSNSNEESMDCASNNESQDDNGLPMSNVSLENLENTQVAVAQYPPPMPLSTQPQHIGSIQEQLYALQQQQIQQLQLIQHIQHQLLSLSSAAGVIVQTPSIFTTAPSFPVSLPSLPPTPHSALSPPICSSVLSTSQSSINNQVQQPETKSASPVPTTQSAPPQQEQLPPLPPPQQSKPSSRPESLSMTPQITQAQQRPSILSPTTFPLPQHPFDILKQTAAMTTVANPLLPPTMPQMSAGLLPMHRKGKPPNVAVYDPKIREEDPFFKHKCRFCHKVFGSDSALQIHVRSHTGERPFKCTICGNRFSTKGNLKVHFQRHKAKYPHVPMDGRPYPPSPTEVKKSFGFPGYHLPIPTVPNDVAKLPASVPDHGTSPGLPVTSPSLPSNASNPSFYSTSTGEMMHTSLGVKHDTSFLRDDSPKNIDVAKLPVPTSEHDVSPSVPTTLPSLPVNATSPSVFPPSTDDQPGPPSMEEKETEDENCSVSGNGDDNASQEIVQEDTRSGDEEDFAMEDEVDETPSPTSTDVNDNAKKSSLMQSPMNPHNMNSITTVVSATSMPQMSIPVIPKSEVSIFTSGILPRTTIPSPYTAVLDSNMKASETSKLQQLVENIEQKLTDPNQCIICHRILSCKSALQMHYRTHTGERPFKCKLCTRAFTTKGNLKTHYGVHRSKPPVRVFHKCPVCHKQFTNAMVLQQHIRMHTGEVAHLSSEAYSSISDMMLDDDMEESQHEISSETPNEEAYKLYERSIGNKESNSEPSMDNLSPPPLINDKSSPLEDSVFFPSPMTTGAASLNALENQVRSIASVITTRPMSTMKSVDSIANALHHNITSVVNTYGIHRPANDPPRSLSLGSPVTTNSPCSSNFEQATGSESGSTSPDLKIDELNDRPLQIDESYAHENGALDLSSKPTTESCSSSPSPAYTPMSSSDPLSPMDSGSNDSLNRLTASVRRGQLSTMCNICGKAFACASALEIHYRSHTKERPFRCDICVKGFSTKGNLKQHMLTHKIRDLPMQNFENSPPVTMNRAPSPVPTEPETNNIVNLKADFQQSPPQEVVHNHDLNSDSLRPKPRHACNTCGKQFQSDSALQIHVRTHTGEKPFKCHICHRCFTTKGNMKVHMGTHMWNGGSSRRGRRMSMDTAPMIISPKEGEIFRHDFLVRHPMDGPYFQYPVLTNGILPKPNEISVIQNHTPLPVFTQAHIPENGTPERESFGHDMKKEVLQASENAEH